MRGERLLRRALQRYWRWQRGLTLGARGVVIDADGRVLLVEQTYSSGWIFPGGGVEYGETIEEALRRELSEEANVEITDRPELFGIYSNWDVYPGDHVALYVVRAWHQPRAPEPNREIARTGFFSPTALPDGTTAGTRRRVAEIVGKTAPTPHW
jgi:8-oxo-dGTP pyrophosphatase MutT (NUDIX family)